MSTQNCDLPVEGWACNLARGHKGPCPTYAVTSRTKDIELMDKFLAFRDCVWQSHATKDEKELMWAEFLRIYTGT